MQHRCIPAEQAMKICYMTQLRGKAWGQIAMRMTWTSMPSVARAPMPYAIERNG